ncbi:patatin-like protein [Microbaculum marinum]|uniref:Patatin-like protein n=1 Tax=Microbaculum marinum TaxID=1764581 RepID=A0AAW9RGQ4_9HYPH
MREKELRLALVLYGGVSLAVYMFGVCREIAKLVRASKQFYEVPAADRATARLPREDSDNRETDTEAVYFDLLKTLAGHTELRVIVDVIAGASAGGINGVFLARSLAHDLPLAPLRDLWLKNADITELIEKEALAGPLSKRFMTPLVSRMLRYDPVLANDEEARSKFDRFVRSRWFRPPFSGKRFTGWMFDAADAMGQGAQGGSLMPEDHALDLFVSITDYNGHPRRVPLDDPPYAVELDHQFDLGFRYRRRASGLVESEFDARSVPGLVFAARATSSFPGAFPPATIEEVETVLRERGGEWPDLDAFIHDKLAAVTRDGRDPMTIPFVDGAVVTNKPFAAAVSALSGRPANREVVRRIIFVDPNPDIEFADTEELPGFFRAIFASMTEIPRNEPIHHELERVAALNQQISVVAEVVDSARPRIGTLVQSILEQDQDPAPSARVFAAWRDTANRAAAVEAGFAFESYLHLKILTVARRVRTIVEAISAKDLVGLGGTIARPLLIEPRDESGQVSAEAIAFLRAFDADFRVRRLRFVIRHLNEFYYSERPEALADPVERTKLDVIKAAFYELLDGIKARLAAPPNGPDAAAAAGTLADPATTAEQRLVAIDALGAALDLAGVDDRLDEVFAGEVLNCLPEWARTELTVAYVGFPFFDVLTLPMTQWEDLDELDIIRVFRISPSDAQAIRKGLAKEKLKGIRLRRFAAFFNRSWRENDYLWGRLVAAERLVTVVMTAAGAAAREIDALSVKKALFREILRAETPHLTADDTLVSELIEEVEQIEVGGFGG